MTNAETQPEVFPVPRVRQPTQGSANWINLLWLSKLRWGAILGQLVTIFAVQVFMEIRLPLTPLFVIVALEVVSNVWVAVWLQRTREVSERALFVLMVADVIALTALLYFTGGPFNPFSFLYLVHIALAAAVLRARWTWALVGLSVACQGALFVDHVWLNIDLHPSRLMGHMRMHLEGMWVAFVVAAAFISYFVTRVQRALAAREEDLAETRLIAARAERLASLATLAAGAAHELSSPLGTIAIAAKELELEFRQRSQDADGVIDDVQLIRQEVNRCRDILEQMAADAGEGAGARFSRVTLREIVERASSRLVSGGAVRVSGDPAALDRVIEVPSRAFEQALRAILRNAQDASTSEESIRVDIEAHDDHVEIQIRDRGVGMSEATLARLGEPFFTTKDTGNGMGLGVFLAQTVVTRLGGRLSFESKPNQGTTATLTLPIPCDNALADA